jgi:hypothetical protein
MSMMPGLHLERVKTIMTDFDTLNGVNFKKGDFVILTDGLRGGTRNIFGCAGEDYNFAVLVRKGNRFRYAEWHLQKRDTNVPPPPERHLCPRWHKECFDGYW